MSAPGYACNIVDYKFFLTLTASFLGLLHFLRFPLFNGTTSLPSELMFTQSLDSLNRLKHNIKIMTFINWMAPGTGRMEYILQPTFHKQPWLAIKQILYWPGLFGQVGDMLAFLCACLQTLTLSSSITAPTPSKQTGD